MAKKGREQFQFTALELGTLALSFAATSALVFLLGFYVGRRAAAEHAGVGESVAHVPVGDAPGEELRPLSRPSAPPAAAPKAPAAPAAQPPAAARPAPSQPAAQQRAVNPPAVPQSLPAARVPSLPEPSAAEAVRNAPPGVPFTVQVLATRNRGEADSLAGDLKRRGYGAYVAAVEDAGGAWYRVRIGHFENAEAARRMAERASREMGLTQAYVSPLYANVP